MAEPVVPATCDVPGCGRAAIACRLQPALPDGSADEWFCGRHAAEEGYCAACGSYRFESTLCAPGDGLCAACREHGP